jgi:signal transduction histidine kinase
MASAPATTAASSRWELAAETIAVKIRWLGLIIGFLLVNVEPRPGADVAALNAILGLGTVYALLDTYYSLRGQVILARSPLAISLLEAIFIALLCYFDGGLESSFRYYYLLSLIVCAIRYPDAVTYATCALHCTSYGLLYLALPAADRHPRALLLTVVLLGWVTWAANAMALLLKRVGDHLKDLNEALQQHQAKLEDRIAERTRQLQETQAHLLHQEKMAAFGLLAAGIAHEVGNPLTSISSLVQMLQRRSTDPYTQEKLALVSGELQRIQTTLRELIDFSRPAATERVWVAPAEIVREALNIAKYYKRPRGRRIQTTLPPDLPPVFAVRGQLVQALLNLVLNAIDATEKGGHIEVTAARRDGELCLEVRDDGPGVRAADAQRLFQPYFTTKPHGTGLGLFVTSKLVADHGGRVSFESPPGQPTVFRIHLPLTGGPA